ncbi:MAG TPA: hypothetical protein VNP95_13595, partial [Thermomicrobiales bacterium]|nr:hypothetical protein [Thermomicrobiales bacterium]
YFLAWKKGLKTTYYLRSRGATQAEKSTLDVNRFGIQPRWMKSRSASSHVQISRTTAPGAGSAPAPAAPQAAAPRPITTPAPKPVSAAQAPAPAPTASPSPEAATPHPQPLAVPSAANLPVFKPAAASNGLSVEEEFGCEACQ